MSPRRKNIMNAISKRAHEVMPPGSSVLLYGSQARGDARPGSDWDILLLLDKDDITSADHDNYIYPLRALGWDIGAIINPIAFTKAQWDANSYTPFHKNVEADAITL